MSAVLLLAHGDATHIMGTVSAIQGDHVTVKLQDGNTEMVMFDKATKYLNGEKAATKADVKVGTRVVIDAKMDEKMKMFLASEVRIGCSIWLLLCSEQRHRFIQPRIRSLAGGAEACHLVHS